MASISHRSSKHRPHAPACILAALAAASVVAGPRRRAGVTRVRYAWADAPFVNLFGKDDLPAEGFEMDVR